MHAPRGLCARETDGKVTKAEFRTALQYDLGMREVSEAECDSLFATFDADGSGEITFREISRMLRKNNGQWGRTAMILVIEAAVCGSLAVVWALGGYGGGAWLSTSAARFFYTICVGWSMFNNLLCGLHWRSQKLLFALEGEDAARSQMSKDQSHHGPPDWRREALLLGALAIPTVGVDTLISVEAATYSGHVLMRVRLYAIGMLVASYVASGYFLWQARAFNASLFGLLAVRAPGILAHLRRMLAWLAVNAWCVVLLTLGVALVNTQFESVGGWQAGLVLSMAGRTLMNFARVRSLDPPLDGTDFANVAPDPDELGAGAAHERRAQLPIRELLFLIVHGERAAGEAASSANQSF